MKQLNKETIKKINKGTELYFKNNDETVQFRCYVDGDSCFIKRKEKFSKGGWSSMSCQCLLSNLFI